MAEMGASATAVAANKPKIILVGEHDHNNPTGRNDIIKALKDDRDIHFFYEMPMIPASFYPGVTIRPLEPYLETDLHTAHPKPYLKQNIPSRFSDALYLMFAVLDSNSVVESFRYKEVLFSTANDALRDKLIQFHTNFPNDVQAYANFVGDTILPYIQSESNGTGTLKQILREYNADINFMIALQILRDNIMLDTIEKYTTSKGLHSESTFVVIVGNEHIANMHQILLDHGYNDISVVHTDVEDEMRRYIVKNISKGKGGGSLRKRYKQTKKSKRRNKSKSKRRKLRPKQLFYV